MFSEGLERDQWYEMNYLDASQVSESKQNFTVT